MATNEVLQTESHSVHYAALFGQGSIQMAPTEDLYQVGTGSKGDIVNVPVLTSSNVAPGGAAMFRIDSSTMNYWGPQAAWLNLTITPAVGTTIDPNPVQVIESIQLRSAADKVLFERTGDALDLWLRTMMITPENQEEYTAVCRVYPHTRAGHTACFNYWAAAGAARAVRIRLPFPWTLDRRLLMPLKNMKDFFTLTVRFRTVTQGSCQNLAGAGATYTLGAASLDLWAYALVPAEEAVYDALMRQGAGLTFNAEQWTALDNVALPAATTDISLDIGMFTGAGVELMYGLRDNAALAGTLAVELVGVADYIIPTRGVMDNTLLAGLAARPLGYPSWTSRSFVDGSKEIKDLQVRDLCTHEWLQQHHYWSRDYVPADLAFIEFTPFQAKENLRSGALLFDAFSANRRLRLVFAVASTYAQTVTVWVRSMYRIWESVGSDGKLVLQTNITQVTN